MNCTRTLSFLAVVSLAPACVDSDPGDGDGDGSELVAIASVSGALFDWETGLPVADAVVEIDSAWETSPPFPTADPIATTTTDENGRFGPVEVVFADTFVPPILLLRATGPMIAPTASDQRLTCTTSGDPPYRCADVDHTITAPSVALDAAWRAELAAGGMANAAATGLVIFEFREVDGAPAPMVTAQSDFEPLVPGGSLRYLADDMVTLTNSTTTATTPSGIALIASERDSDRISGTRALSEWPSLGVLFAAGWYFLEDRAVR